MGRARSSSEIAMFIVKRPLFAVAAGLIVAWAVPVATGLVLDHADRSGSGARIETTSAPVQAGTRVGGASAAGCQASDPA